MSGLDARAASGPEVEPERRLRILTALRPEGDQPAAAERLCEVATTIIGVSGAGIMLLSGDSPTGSICSTDAVSHQIETLQYELAEGPCVDAYSSAQPVLAPDLRGLDAASRWPAFAPAALDAGARAVFGFPLQLGAVRVGALNLYGDAPGNLTDDQHADALVMADVLAEAVLMLQAGAPPGDLAAALSNGDLHLAVHQASGMVSVQLGVTIPIALARLRAWAYAHEMPLESVARAVIDRRLRFEPDDGELA